MRIQICAVGRMRAGPEKTLVDDYLQRFDRTGRGLGLGPANIFEVEDKKGGGRVAEATLLRNCCSGSVICALDERGQVLNSPEFAKLLANWRDQGHSEATFLIGGADGLDSTLRDHANVSLSFGKMVWPHMFARIMLTEQLYRAVGILAGTPYHRN
ncbi:MAG: 23S rRNA (pseudouridine(1915)-N(3))-methyltransferase RlmH [Paracoccaceae bacterium]